MAIKRWRSLFICILLTGTQVLPAWAQGGGGRRGRGGRGARGADAATTQTQGGGFARRGGGGSLTVPADLNALLTPKQSEMRIVTTRYEADRRQLSNFYDVATSPNRAARLKRFDVDWQAALEKIDADRLSPAAKTDLTTLKGSVQKNMRELDAESSATAQIMPLIPFSAEVAKLEEGQMRMDSLDGEKAAVALSKITEQIGKLRARLQDGLSEGEKPDALKVSKDQATRAAEAVEALQGNLDSWYGFYNMTDRNGNELEYDPLFAWWVRQPYPEAYKAMSDYTAFLRNKVAPETKLAATPAMPATPVVAAAAPKVNEVPDLQELLNFPQDEMRGVLQAYGGGRGGFGGRGGRGGRSGRGGRGGRGANANATTSTLAMSNTGGDANGNNGTVAAAGGRGSDDTTGRAPATNDNATSATRKYLNDWSAALKKLDFDKLSRPGQIDYLYIRHNIEARLKRLDLKPLTKDITKPDGPGITGPGAIGRDALIVSLNEEMIPYTPEELIALANKEFAWCESEMKKASREMGLGDDWKKAIEKAKETGRVPPGKQPDMIRDLMLSAVAFERKHELITVPEIESETLRMEMMSPERQLVNPFFTGGALISVSYPTDTMTTQQKLESMRGNNYGFSHATSFHEMIPGHNMQGYMSQRFSVNRPSLGGTAFFGEGWAVYWETLMYDQGYDSKPEEKIGALFWRMHRCARIVFSLEYQLGNWSPQQCIDYLVDKVGHERENATAEVRRSFNGSYPPLYQAAYLIGALQLRNLHKDLVDSGQMTNKQFHDQIIQNGSMPIAMIRLNLSKEKLTPDTPVDWKFYGPNPGK